MASVIASNAAVYVMTGGIGYQAAVSGAQTDSTENSVKAQNTDQQESTDGSFSEEGTTQIGTVSQMPEFTVNAVTMTVEEVYASSGDTVSKGDALFKLTDESMEAAKSDYEDALSILGWDPSKLGVEKSSDGSRMNEVKCHGKWALRIATLGDIYGIREE